MALMTPGLAGQDALGALASRYIDIESLPWKPTLTPGIDMKILMQDKDTGLMTALFRWAPGTALPRHEHVDVEQSYLIAGSLVDEEGEVTAGNYVWRPARSRHVARSPNGALVLTFFLRPNVILEGDAQGRTLE